jgi:hypothetical protein
MNNATRCIKCGRALTNPISIRRGIGPICNKKTFIGGLLRLTEFLDRGPLNNGDDHFPTLRDYLKTVQNWTCRCGGDLRKGEPGHYKHSGGYPLHNYHDSQWIYIRCLDCHKAISLPVLQRAPRNQGES